MLDCRLMSMLLRCRNVAREVLGGLGRYVMGHSFDKMLPWAAGPQSKWAQKRCPTCYSYNSAADRFLAVYLRPELRGQCSTGEPPVIECAACAEPLPALMPAIYDDPELNLLVYVCPEDSGSLIADFHDLLERCRSKISDQHYDDAWRRPFQITLGWTGLQRVLSDLRQPSHPMRVRSNLDGSWCQNMFLRAAEVNMTAGKAKRACDILVRSSKYPIHTPKDLLDLAGLVRDRGFPEHAELLCAAAREVELQPDDHVWEKVFRIDNDYMDDPPDMRLPLLQANIRSAYDLLRPRMYLPAELAVEACGVVIGYLQRADQEYGFNMLVGINLHMAESFTNNVLREASERKRAKLVDIFHRARQEGLAVE